MIDFNPSQKLAACCVMAGLLFPFAPLRASNPPTYLGQIDGSTVPNPVGIGPNGLAIDTSNNLYVLDYYNNRVVKFSSTGVYLSQWGGTGTGAAQLENPNAIAIDSSNDVYIADENVNNQSYFIKKFDANGVYLTQWGSQGVGNGQFLYGISGIAVDASQNVYASDGSNTRVQKFTRNGAYLSQWGTNIAGSQFSPTGVAAGAGGYIYVSDLGDVAKFDTNGSYLGKWSLDVDGDSGVEAAGIAASGGSVYVCGSGVIVQSFSANGSYQTQWGVHGSVISESLQDVAVDNTGNYIYVADSFNYRVQIFANNPNIIPPFDTTLTTNETVLAGLDVTLDPVVVGGRPFTFQWTSNNVPLPGATNATLSLSNVSLADSATYSLLITNSYGSASNIVAILTVVPAIPTTLPATGISATGAVLNGSITPGPEDASVWFEWGTDTNYGNSTAMTIVPDNSETNLSATLNGLSFNTYHYQIVASNISGVVHGNDQSFVVAAKEPTAKTLLPVNAANGVTLYGIVNPNGADTAVYFRWGPGFELTNTTAVTNVGAGVAPLTIGSLITGLAPGKQFDYEVVASNALGEIFGTQAAFYSAPFDNVPNENWDSVASSADGSVLVAVANEVHNASPEGLILISTNSGAAWSIATSAPTNGWWETVACSADGSKMIAAGGGADTADFPIYTSPDMGATWVSNDAPVLNWQSVASSADGARLVAAAEHDQVIYTSTNSGATWKQAATAPAVSWFSVALSADGTKLAAVASGSTNIFTSPDFGATWITNNAPTGPGGVLERGWSSIASSADGSRLIAATGGNGNAGFIFLSTNSGASWNLTATNIFLGLVAHPWLYVASSADGGTMAAVSDAANSLLGVVITSTNSGATWRTNAVPLLNWNAVALSADGAKLVASIGYPTTGPIYVSQTTPAPVLHLSAANGVISWTIPSLDFTLQQSPDLLNWSDVTNPALPNLSTLQNQITLPASATAAFFRLKH